MTAARDVERRCAADHAEQLRLVVVIGSVRTGRLGDAVGRWFLTQVRSEEWKVEVVDLIDYQIDPRLPAEPGRAPLQWPGGRRRRDRDRDTGVQPRVPGPLKTAIDTAYGEWHAKAVAFVSYGGSSGGIRAVEQLRSVFAEVQAVTMREAVMIPHVYARFDTLGRLADPDRPQAAARTMLDQLGWWTRALSRARAAEPYV